MVGYWGKVEMLCYGRDEGTGWGGVEGGGEGQEGLSDRGMGFWDVVL